MNYPKLLDKATHSHLKPINYYVPHVSPPFVGVGGRMTCSKKGQVCLPIYSKQLLEFK